MQMQSHIHNGVATLRLSGRFDAYEAPPVARWLQEAALARVVVNLGDVTFIDSTALGTLIKGMKQCRQQGGDLRVCSLQQPVRIIFELTRLDKAFTFFPDETEAIQTPW